eukprot:snap_masked-scaffold_5-processed-gene-5.29-mRNA-1 protein AED:1.00 eAED:1.00 QI:0/-1/0/0/-1/1/1/0/240
MNNIIVSAATAGVAYKLTSVIGVVIGKALEAAAEKAIYNFAHGDEPTPTNSVTNFYTVKQFNSLVKTHSLQFILMEMDVEAKVKFARSLIESIREIKTGKNLDKYAIRSSDDITERNKISGLEQFQSVNEIAVSNLEEVCNKMLENLHENVYKKIDEQQQSYFASFKKLDVAEDMIKLQSQLKVYESRLDSVLKWLNFDSEHMMLEQKDLDFLKKLTHQGSGEGNSDSAGSSDIESPVLL